MKHYTTIEQSKKLLELGLNSKASDMFYQNDGYDTFFQSPNVKENAVVRNIDLPCWSLGALLEVIPDEIKTAGTNCNLHIAKDFISYEGFDRYDTSTTIQPMVFYDKPFIELLFKAICWLLENGYIKKELKTSSE